MTVLAAATQSIHQYLRDQPPHHLTLRLTAIFLILYPIDYPLTILKILAGIMLFYPAALLNKWLWLLVSLECARMVTRRFYSVNNHEFLITYWCITCWIAVQSQDTEKVLAWNARILIGLSFLFAEAWKFLAGEFLNGSFLYAFFLKDYRFSDLALWLSDIRPQDLVQNRNWIEYFKLHPAAGLGINLYGSGMLKIFALVFSYWTILIEAVLSVAFLCTRPAWLHRYRSIPLMIFIGTTYFIVPLHRFALILNVLGFAQCPKDLPALRLAHLVLFVLILLF